MIRLRGFVLLVNSLLPVLIAVGLFAVGEAL